MSTEDNSLIKDYALIKVGKDNLLELYDSFGSKEKVFRAYLAEHEKAYKKGEVEYYAISENGKYITQVTVIYNHSIKDSTEKNKRVYFNNLNSIKSKANIGFEKLLLELVINKLQEKSKYKTSIFEYTISIGNRERIRKKLLEELNFKEIKSYTNTDNKRTELLYLREDIEK